ncbi:MAG: transcriptional regulator, MarR family [Devosia sp.]|nr:transcriptional regulator, MarR family [Devosia sp.]
MPHSRDPLVPALAAAGVSASTIEGLMRIDGVMQGWRRRITKRELGHRGIAELGLTIDLAQLDVLVAIDAPLHEFGETGHEETMVQTVAERIGIDPSRASRLVAEMVDLGYAVRIASQTDARRTLIALTAAGKTIVDAVRLYKFMHLGAFLDGWTEEERRQFIPLLERFSNWSDQQPAVDERFKSEIANRARQIEAAMAPLGRKTG